MKNTVIKQTIEISAPKEKVWDVLINDKYTRIWYAEFSEGTYADTDWQEGSKAVFKDKSESGLVCKVIANKPYEVLSLEYEGILNGGKEDYDSNEAKNLKGGHETYRLEESDGVTRLITEADMSPDMFEMMSESWQRAIQKVKSLSESN